MSIYSADCDQYVVHTLLLVGQMIDEKMEVTVDRAHLSSAKFLNTLLSK